ncbi:hypothetical protein SAMN05216241_101156 [Limimonas halophila]|uniref:Uncharacterized protein n=1 Tax=Limimonas halophila TaxID=1082479 RepID=A0A1G7L8E1_9PROT|nr:hypothetical protein [Limimonas halophila]SDF45723.1 hypothetical protein SAMN05216241_101156 [Limimonas halophila]
MKALKALVIGMAVLIVLGLGVVVAKIIADSSDATGPRADLGTLHLGLDDACRIAGVTGTDDRLVVRLDGPADAGCGEVLLVDPGAGKVVGRIAPGQAPKGSS